MIIVTIIHLIFKTAKMIQDQEEFKFYNYDKSIFLIAVNVSWYVVDKKFLRRAPVFVFVPHLLLLFYLMLSANEWMPYEVNERTHMTLLNSYTFLLLSFNRSSFLSTLILKPPLLMMCYYFAFKSEAKFVV
jgi:hypothetical protein